MPVLIGITEEEFQIWRENADMDSFSRTIWVHLRIDATADGYRPVVMENLTNNLDDHSPRGRPVQKISDANSCHFGGLVKALKQYYDNALG